MSINEFLVAFAVFLLYLLFSWHSTKTDERLNNLEKEVREK